MDNVIVVLIDSVYSQCIFDKRLGVSCTPFIDTLIEKGFFAPNVYSFGPYTDAATKGLYSGKPTLSDYGYYYGIASSDDNHFKTFKLNGYETYGLYYPYYLVSSKHEKYIDHSIYTSGFLYDSVWNGKYEYYSNIQKVRELTDLEYDILIKCMELVFDCWFGFYRNIENQDGSDKIVQRLYNPQKGTGVDGLKQEYERFCLDKKKYMDNVLAEGIQHNLAKINNYEFEKNVNTKFMAEIYSCYSSFFKKLAKKNVFLNLKNNHISARKSLRRIGAFFKTKDKKELRYFGNYGMCVLSAQMTKKRALSGKNNSGAWQNLCSLNKQVSTVIDVLEKRDRSRPFYFSLHCLEPHHDISFFSYDCDDLEQIRTELDYISPVIDNVDKKFAGNLVYYLSLRYVDLCVKQLYNGLEKCGLLDNTTIMLMADHGTSYIHFPVRNHVVNTFHKENYNVPLIIYKRGMTKLQSNGFFDSSDIFPTLFDVVGIKNKSGFNGISGIQRPEGRKYVITEYMGPGCPDMLNREVWISIRNNKYVIAYQNPINKPLDKTHPVYLYDLSHDKTEQINYNTDLSLLNNNEIQYLIEQLNVRYMDIQKETKNIMNDFSEFTII